MTRAKTSEIIHASAVAVRGRGVLILGASGVGKSGLALRMMSLGADLVADDRVALSQKGGGLRAEAPVRLRGKIEARGVGILSASSIADVGLVLAVDLDRSSAARMPQPMNFTSSGVNIPLIFGGGVPNLDSVLMVMAQACEVSDG